MSKLKNTFFTSDWHIGHVRRVLINNFNASVKFGDVTYFVGDIGVTANNYRPVSISQIESWISLYKRCKEDETK